MIKKLIAILCAFTCLTTSMVSATPLFDDISEGTTEEKVLSIVTGIGLMEGRGGGTFAPREHVTRAEVAQIIYNALTHTFGGNSGNDDHATSTFEWIDLDDSHWAYGAVNYVAELGIMIGDGNGSFRPEDTVTYREIIKTVLNLSGYEYEAEFHGGWPVGYERIASNNDLNKGVSGVGDSKMSRMDVAKILYNLFALPTRELKWNGHVTTIEANEETFMNDKMNIHAITGTLTKTDITSVDGSSEKELYTAEIDGFEFIFDSQATGIREDIGKNLRIFVYENEEDEVYELLCYEETGRDEVTDIDARYLVDFSDKTFTYYNDEDDTKKRTVEVGRGFHVIYNGKYLDSHNDETFDIAKGNIRVITNTSTGYDIVIVEEFTSAFVSSVNPDNYTIKNEIGTGSNKTIEFQSEDKDIIYSIYDANGKEIRFSGISNGVLSYYENDNYIKAHSVNSKSVFGTVQSKYSDEGKSYLRLNGVDYIIEDSYYELDNAINVEIGMEVTAYLDKWGEIVWLISSAQIANAGYLVSAVQEDDGEKIFLKYFDLTSKEGVMTEVAENLKLSDAYGVESKLLSYEAIKVALEDYQGIFSYEMNAEGLINKIELPVVIGRETNSSSRIRTMLQTDNNSASPYYSKNYPYHPYLRLFINSSVYVDGDTLVLTVPEDKKDFSEYSLRSTTSALKGVQTAVFSVYNYDEDSKIAKLIILDKASASYTVSGSSSLAIVTKVEYVYDEDLEEAVTQVTVSDGTTESVIVPDIDLVDFEAVPSVFRTFEQNRYKRYSLSPGDMIRYSTIDGKVSSIYMIFDADGKNPAWYGADPDDDIAYASDIPEDDYINAGVLGTIPGSTGFDQSPDIRYSNPFALTSGSPSHYQVKPGNNDCHNVFIYGYVHSFKDGLYTVTTQNLSAGFTGFDDENYFNMDLWFEGRKFVIVKNSRNGISVESGTIDNIKTYEEAGVDCSRVLLYFNSAWGLTNVYVFVNE